MSARKLARPSTPVPPATKTCIDIPTSYVLRTFVRLTLAFATPRPSARVPPRGRMPSSARALPELGVCQLDGMDHIGGIDTASGMERGNTTLSPQVVPPSIRGLPQCPYHLVGKNNGHGSCRRPWQSTTCLR